MKTTEEWMTLYGGIGRDEIAEIQRDAREGTVPVEDVRALLDAFINPSNNGDEFIGEMQQKHPNLFPK